ncbi:extradiol ring-cleavage dioxygenase class iii protein-like protein subunit B [Cadophora sp. DSE1049]|nr:extradiol ring-cleavage dioxygenase class iii protein-like protein subunit B [Cadophora sp. DSE1049]
MSTIMARAASVAICHGGGPLPLMGGSDSAEIAKSLSTKAIVIVTAHWSERNPTISNGLKHELYFDYRGFPPETFKYKYDAPGSPEVAQEVFDALQSAAMAPVMNSKRGWDHGVFVPMLLINPGTDVPIVQLSVLDSDSPRELYKMGVALSSLRDRNIAIVGSGAASFHDIDLHMRGGVHEKTFRPRNIEWSKALSKKGLEHWRDLPGAKDMHPEHKVEHFSPLIVCAGAGGDSKAQKYGDEMMGAEMFTYYWT